ncbi:unnamed protein product [marine sediment metagenome]|uniref:Uncharacterized protein n=1 Tax=marine sediment metagenome TaxID=412755 RepID=X1ER66_9ZZZZ
MPKINHFKPDPELLKIKDVPGFILKQTGIRRGMWIVYHWIKKGRRSYSGHNTKLKVHTYCGQIFTRQSWVMEFLRKLEE